MLFRDFSLVSSLSFPPVVPVMLTPIEPDRFITSKKSRCKHLHSSLGGAVDFELKMDGNTLFYSADIPGWDELRLTISEFVTAETTSNDRSFTQFFDSLDDAFFSDKTIILSEPGIFMGLKKERPMPVLHSEYPLSITWKKGELVCFAITVDTDINWWEKISFEEIV